MTYIVNCVIFFKKVIQKIKWQNRSVLVSLEKELLTKFDKRIKEEDYPIRSKAIGDLIREKLLKKEWLEGKEAAGTIALVYKHHLKIVVVKRKTERS